MDQADLSRIRLNARNHIWVLVFVSLENGLLASCFPGTWAEESALARLAAAIIGAASPKSLSALEGAPGRPRRLEGQLVIWQPSFCKFQDASPHATCLLLTQNKPLTVNQHNLRAL